MHPALSVIFFTSLSGAGYGLLFLLSLGGVAQVLPSDPWFGGVSLGTALVLIVVGLLSSTLHLGHPERAWRAFSQWRSSWLSREGVASIFTFAPMLALLYSWVLGDGPWIAAGVLSAAGALITVFCTAQIYASLKTVRQWRHPLVPALYLLFALASGGLLLLALLLIFTQPPQEAAFLAAISITAVWLLKLRFWRDIDGGRSPATPESATGLGALGKVRLLEPPHTEENYLLKEMGYRVARKHAWKLRKLAGILGFLLPLALLLLILASAGWWELPLAIVATLSALFGILIERWLFFAEATHTVTLFYGRQA